MKTARNWGLVALVVFLLMLGLLNYLLFQPHIFLYGDFYSQAASNPVPATFFTQHFSDLVWCSALCLTVVILNRIRRLNNPQRIFILSLPFFHETLQYLGVARGTFDLLDILLYGLIILVFNRSFSSVIFINMKKLKDWLPASAVFIFFLATALASTAPKATYKSKPLPCVKHKPVTYSPVLVRINISGSYTMKNLSGAQRSGSEYLMDIFHSINPYKYKLADGVAPNMTLSITFNLDGYGHYAASLYGSLYDGDFNYTFPMNYVTPEKLLDDIAAKVDSWIRNGWCNNCPSPCDVNN